MSSSSLSEEEDNPALREAVDPGFKIADSGKKSGEGNNSSGWTKEGGH